MSEEVTLADEAREIALLTQKTAEVEYRGVVYHLRRPKAWRCADLWDMALDKESHGVLGKSARLMAALLTTCIEKTVADDGTERHGFSEDQADDFFFENREQLDNDLVRACRKMVGLDGEKDEAEQPTRPT